MPQSYSGIRCTVVNLITRKSEFYQFLKGRFVTA
jgi:hypothetical protein